MITRYPGPLAFTEEYSSPGLFNGRDKDIYNLERIINGRKITILFGESAVGKSSLLQVGLRNKFLEESNQKQKSTNYQYYNIREVIEDSEFYFDLIRTLTEPIGDKKSIIILDQYESLENFKNDKDGDRRDRASKIEEALVYSISERYQIDENPTDVSYDLHFLISIRKAEIASLHPLAQHIRGLMDTRYELKHISVNDAIKCITLPASLKQKSSEIEFESPPFSYSNETIKKILELTKNKRDVYESTNETVDTFLLQLICGQIENEIIKENVSIVNQGNYGKAKNLENTIKSYLDHQLNSALRTLSFSNRLNALDFISHDLVGFNGERNIKGENELGQAIWGKNNFDENREQHQNKLREIIESLSRSRIIRKIPIRAGQSRFEIAHRRFAKTLAENRKPIKKKKIFNIAKIVMILLPFMCLPFIPLIGKHKANIALIEKQDSLMEAIDKQEDELNNLEMQIDEGKQRLENFTEKEKSRVSRIKSEIYNGNYASAGILYDQLGDEYKNKPNLLFFQSLLRPLEVKSKITELKGEGNSIIFNDDDNVVIKYGNKCNFVSVNTDILVNESECKEDKHKVYEELAYIKKDNDDYINTYYSRDSLSNTVKNLLNSKRSEIKTLSKRFNLFGTKSVSEVLYQNGFDFEYYGDLSCPKTKTNLSRCILNLREFTGKSTPVFVNSSSNGNTNSLILGKSDNTVSIIDIGKGGKTQSSNSFRINSNGRILFAEKIEISKRIYLLTVDSESYVTIHDYQSLYPAFQRKLGGRTHDDIIDKVHMKVVNNKVFLFILSGKNTLYSYEIPPINYTSPYVVSDKNSNVFSIGLAGQHLLVGRRDGNLDLLILSDGKYDYLHKKLITNASITRLLYSEKHKTIYIASDNGLFHCSMEELRKNSKESGCLKLYDGAFHALSKYKDRIVISKYSKDDGKIIILNDQEVFAKKEKVAFEIKMMGDLGQQVISSFIQEQEGKEYLIHGVRGKFYGDNCIGSIPLNSSISEYNCWEDMNSYKTNLSADGNTQIKWVSVEQNKIVAGFVGGLIFLSHSDEKVSKEKGLIFQDNSITKIGFLGYMSSGEKLENQYWALSTSKGEFQIWKYGDDGPIFSLSLPTKFPEQPLNSNDMIFGKMKNGSADFYLANTYKGIFKINLPIILSKNNMIELKN